MASALARPGPAVLLRAAASSPTSTASLQLHRASSAMSWGAAGKAGSVGSSGSRGMSVVRLAGGGGFVGGGGGSLASPVCPAPLTRRWAQRPQQQRAPGAFRLFSGSSDSDGPGSVDDSDDDRPGMGGRDFNAMVRWLPAMDPSKEDEVITPEQAIETETMVLPVFPLGSMVYMPHSDHVLNIFEPRYRQMYSDILFNGSRRFVVPCSNPETGQLAGVGAVFYLEDLKEVSEQTADAVKYVCSHKVIGRVSIKRTLNDRVWADRTGYLKAVVEPLEDGDDDEDLSTREGQLTERFAAIIENQTKLQETVRFTENLIDTLSAARGEDGLWRLAGLWQSLLQNRLTAKENELSTSIQELLRNYLANLGQGAQSKVTLQFDALPAEVRAEFTRLQQTYREESLAMVNSTLFPFVLLVQCDSHAERLNVFGQMLEEEEKRLQAKVALQSLFGNFEKKDEGKGGKGGGGSGGSGKKSA